MDAFIRFAEWADVLLNVLHEIEDDPFLMIPGMEADRAKFAYFCQGSVKG
jgi:hypothetical protein